MGNGGRLRLKLRKRTGLRLCTPKPSDFCRKLRLLTGEGGAPSTAKEGLMGGYNCNPLNQSECNFVI